MPFARIVPAVRPSDMSQDPKVCVTVCDCVCETVCVRACTALRLCVHVLVYVGGWVSWLCAVVPAVGPLRHEPGPQY